MELGNTILITQARTGSTRLPGKVLLKIDDAELLKIHLDRIYKCKTVDHVIVATTTNEDDDIINELCKNWNVQCSRGSENDVLDRFYQSVSDSKPTWIIRVTSDCPLIDPDLIDAVVNCAKINDVDYCSNGLIENFPDGQDVEVFKFSALQKAWLNAKLKSEREHVTPYIRNHSNHHGQPLFNAVNFPCRENFSAIRMTVDEHADFELIKRLVLELGVNESWLSYTKYIIENGLNRINENIVRNEGLLKSLKND